MKLKLLLVIDTENLAASHLQQISMPPPVITGINGNGFRLENDLGVDQKLETKARPQNRDEVIRFVTEELKLSENDARWLWDHWQGTGFRNGGEPMNSWRHTARAWMRANLYPSLKGKMK